MNELLKTLLTISLTASAMILVVLGVRAMLAKRMSPAVIAALWAVVLLRLCVPITLESPVHVGDLIPEAPVVTEQTVEAEVPTVNVPQTNTVVNHVDIPTTVNNTIPPQTEVVVQPKVVNMTQPTVWQRMVEIAEGISLWSVLAAVWILGAVVVLGNTVRQGVKFNRRLKKCKRVTDGEIRYIVNELRSQLGIKRYVEVVECDDIGTPAVFGFFRPVVILPAKYAHSMGINGVRCILLHEMCHIKRKDILKSYAWLIAKAMHCFNPLVWLAFRKAKDDIELCCDQMVIAQMSKDKQYEYTQSLIDVIRIAQQKNAFAPTVSLFERKAQLVERVRRMVKPHKRSRGAAAVSVLIAVMMILVCFTTACQPVAKVDEPVMPEPTAKIAQEEPEKQTPQAEVVVSEQLQEEVKEPLAKYSITDHWTDSVEREDSIIKLDINADIVMPDVDTFNTYYVNRTGVVTQEMTDKIIKLLFGDAPLYGHHKRTKASYQEEIDELENSYQSMLDGTFDFSHYVKKESAIEGAKERITRLESYMKDAPETVEPIPMNQVLAYNDRGEADIWGEADLGREEKAYIGIHNFEFGSRVHFWDEGGYHDRQEKSCQVPIGNLTITEEEAVSRVDAFLEKIGLNDYQLVNNYIAQRFITFMPETEQFAHVLEYTRVVDDIEISQNEYMPALDSMNCYMERMSITIDDDGFREIYWSYGFGLGETASKDQKLLPIEEIEDIIAEKMYIHEPMILQMREEDIGIPGFKIQECTFNIDQIRLEYMKLPYENDVEDIRLIPVWSVSASRDLRFTKDENGETVEDVRNWDKSYLHLAINALDGSMVDKELWANKKFY